MCVEAYVELELLLPPDDDRDRYALDLSVHGSPHHLSVVIEHPHLGRPVVARVDGGFGLDAETRDDLTLALWRHLSGHLGDGEAGFVSWVRWVEPDLMPWLARHLNGATASRAAHALARHSTLTAPRLHKGFTEGLVG